MTRYKPAFEVSPERRSLPQRFTPLAWALTGVAAVVALLGLVVAGMALLGRPAAGPWSPTPTATAPPSATPLLPTASPSAWWEGAMTATPEPTAAFPAWWSEQMTQDEDGLWWPPDEVVEMVREDFDGFGEFNRQVFFAEEVPDLDTYEARLPEWFSGPYLEFQREVYVPEVRTGVRLFRTADWEECLVQIKEWSPDGLECTVGRSCRDGMRYSYDFAIDEHTSEQVAQMGLVLIRMRYDPGDGRWKMHVPLEFIPPPEE